jgi:hypothetical protein
MHFRGLAVPAVVLFALFSGAVVASAQVDICPSDEGNAESCEGPSAAVPVAEAATGDDVTAPVVPSVDLSPPTRDDWRLYALNPQE